MSPRASWVLSPFTLLLNQALAQDPETHIAFAALGDKHIAVQLTDLGVTIQVATQAGNIELSHQKSPDDTADLTLTVRSMALLRMLQDPDTLFSSDIRLRGDVQFAKALQDVLAQFEFDWTAQIARVTGDTLAQPISDGLHAAQQWAHNTGRDLSLDMAEYLREESRILPDKSEVKAFLNNVDILRADCDRLAARINRLKD